VVESTLAVEFDEKRIDAIFAGLDQCHLPGAAVGIALGGKPVYRRGFGLANMELPVLLSPATRMRIASTTKHFAAFLYMLLCEEKRAGLDDPIGKYLPELHPSTREVTMRQLMGNISGLRDVFDITWVFSGLGRQVSSAELLALYRHVDDANAEPGTTWIYNNGGWLMLSIAIERITGQPLEEVLQERIFGRLGMYDTMLRRFDMDFVPNSAALHVRTAAGSFEKKYVGTAVAGEGGMVSTINDMLRWMAHMDAPVLGSEATWKLMRMSQTLRNGTATGYGLGLMSGRYRGVETIYHPGGWLGGNAQMLKVPSANLAVVIIANRSDVSALLLSKEILDTCLPGLDPLKEASQRVPIAGTFRSPKTGRVIQLYPADQQVVSIDGTDMPVEPDGDGVLWPAGMYGNVKQGVSLIGGSGQPAALRFSDFGNPDELVRMPAIDAPRADAIVGRYSSNIAGIGATIADTTDGPRLHTTGWFGSTAYPLECLAAGIWRAKQTDGMPWGGVLSFDSEGGAFSFSTYNTKSLCFRRDG
jgi:CubicO group peptidase (beta-lactamase class C family)